MRKLTNYRIPTCVFIVLLGIAGTSAYFYFFKGPGMLLPLTKVTGFSRKISLLSTVDHDKVILTNYSREGYLSSRVISPQTKSIGNEHRRYFPSFAIRPDGSRFFIGSGEEIVEYDSCGEYVRRVAIGEFDLEPHEDRLFGSIQASNSQLWLQLGSFLESEYLIVEWLFDKEPGTREIVRVDLTTETDPFGLRSLTFEHSGGFYTLDAKEVVGRLWAECNVSDILASDSVLLSSDLANSRGDRISILDISKNSKRDVTWGAMARWAADGYIYFVRGSTQLWRCKPGEKPEAVYLATRAVRGGKECAGHELIFNHDRTCLAFCYRVPCKEISGSTPHPGGLESGNMRCGVLLIDLKNLEYMEVSAEDFYDIYLDLNSKGGLSFSEDILHLITISGDDFWHIRNMSLFVQGAE